MRSNLLRALLVAMLAVACGAPGGAAVPGGSGGPAASSRHELTILAAASLTTVLADVKTRYVSTDPGTTLRISTGSSAALEAQIEQGARADVFLSADSTNPQRLVDGGFAGDAPRVFAGNELTVVVPAENEASIRSWQDLAGGHRIIAAGEAVPISRYADELIANLAALPDAPAGFAKAYAASIVSREENVQAVVAKIELGEGDAAIVYATDAAASDGVLTLGVPDAANVRASYAGVVLANAGDRARAAGFLDWLLGSEGQAILARHGFLPPPA